MAYIWYFSLNLVVYPNFGNICKLRGPLLKKGRHTYLDNIIVDIVA